MLIIFRFSCSVKIPGETTSVYAPISWNSEEMWKIPHSWFLPVMVCMLLCWRSFLFVQFFSSQKIWPLSVLSKIEITKNELKCAVSGADFFDASGDKEAAHKAGETGCVVSISGLGRSPGEGSGNPLQYSCLGNPMDRGAWRATVHGVAESRTWLRMCTHISGAESNISRVYWGSFSWGIPLIWCDHSTVCFLLALGSM